MPKISREPMVKEYTYLERQIHEELETWRRFLHKDSISDLLRDTVVDAYRRVMRDPQYKRFRRDEQERTAEKAGK